ncbi:MAG TPA: hypothetical protein VGL93_23200 [Streptosporangiaceae bacterium]
MALALVILIVLAIVPSWNFLPNSARPFHRRPVLRRTALKASYRCARAFWSRATKLRRIRLLGSILIMPFTHSLSRWRPRSVILIDESASLRVIRWQGNWRLVDVAAWPSGTHRGIDLLSQVCAEADRVGITLHITTANQILARKVYEPLGFSLVPSGGPRHMVRIPR